MIAGPNVTLQRCRNQVDDFGAKGDSTATGGGTDDTTKIQAAINACAANPKSMQGKVIVPAGKIYRITDTLTVPVTVDLICEGDGTIVYEGSSNESAITIGDTADYYLGRRLRLNVKRAATSTWTNEASVGVTLINPVNCDLDFAHVEGFTIGIQWKAHLAAAYNYGIKLGQITNNKYGLDLHSYDANGYCNENHFIGGRFSYTTAGDVDGVSRYAIRFKSEAGAYTGFNSNSFDGFTVELSSSAASPGVARVLLINNDSYNNAFTNYRSELNTEPHIEIASGSDARANTFRPLFNQIGTSPLPTDMISWGGNRKADIVESPEAYLFKTQSEWNSGDLLSKSVWRTSGGFEYVHTTGGTHWEVSAGGGAASLVTVLHNTSDGEFFVCSGCGPAVCIDSTKNKRFVARKQVKAATPGRFVVRCYNGHPLNGGSIIGSSTLLVRGMSSGSEPAWSSGTYGGCYTQQSDSDTDWFFSVDSTVKYFVLIAIGAKINGLSVGSVDPYPITAFPLHGINDGNLYLDDTPDTGNGRFGKRALKSNRTLDTEPLGWVYEDLATDTWMPFYGGAAIGATWDSGDLPTKTTQRTTGGFENTHTIGVHWEVGSGGGATALVQSLHLTNNGDFLTPTGSAPSACIVFDAINNKRFIARKNVSSGTPGRFAIRCYDGHPLDGGSIITTGAAHVTVQSGSTVSWQSGTCGGSYLQISDADAPFEFTLSSTVKYAVLICYNAEINSFSLSTRDSSPIHCFPLHGVNDGLRYMDDVPDTGSYKDGTVVFNSDQSATITIPTHWTCTVTGTPGTWVKAYRGQLLLVGTTTWDPASLATGASASTTVTVSGATVGDVVIPSLSTLTQDGMLLTATVSASNTVKVTLANVGGTNPTDVTSGTLRVQVFQ